MNKKVKKILQFSLDYNFEIVSYGLAPNPNGFCYEDHNSKRNNNARKVFNDLLNSLNKEETLELRKYIFG